MLPVFKRFTISDTPNAPNWLESVYGPLNLFCEQTVQTLNKNLTFGGNVQGQKFSVALTTPSDYATGGFQPISFSYTGGGQPNCCLVGQISRQDGTRILSPVVVTDWLMNINTSPYTVNINYIAGLAASTKYNVTLVVL